jgi:hypothetical protein
MLKKILMIGAMVAMSSSVFAAFDTTTSDSTSIAGSASQSGAISGSASNVDNNVRNTNANAQGQGQGQQQGNANSVNNEFVDNSVNTVEATQIPVASAASVFVQSCQYGASGQGQSAGLSMGADSAQCMNLRQAAIHLEQFNRVNSLAIAAPQGAGKVDLYKLANTHLAKFHHYLDKADDAADYAHPTKVVGGGVADILPVGILIGIFTLI